MLKQRIITAAILIPAVIFASCTLNMIWFTAFTGVFICLGAWEWAAMSGYGEPLARVTYMLLFPAVIAGCLYLADTGIPSMIIVISVLWWLLPAMYLILGFRIKPAPVLDSRFLKAGMGLAVLIPAWLSLVMLHELRPDGVILMLFLLFLIWIADSSAYFAGRRWGRTRLYPEISPGKTWAGVYGALAAALIFAFSYAWFSKMQAVEILIFLVICVGTVAVSIEGDLMVSMIKRKAQLKDSGSLLPGHGGIMDRIDSLTAAGPIFLAGVWLVRGMQ